jgi:hypothetical protein
VSAQTTARQPKGIPAGGQFAATSHPEPSLVLAAPADKAWRSSDVIVGLNRTQRRSVAASLEIDGRPDRAAVAGISGHISEFQYRKGVPDSPKAKRQEELRQALKDAVKAEGVEGTVAALREEE